MLVLMELQIGAVAVVGQVGHTDLLFLLAVVQEL
jgi:hypothetical protein